MTDLELLTSSPWLSGTARAREALEQGLADLTAEVERLENDPRAKEADLNFARYAVARYREVLR